MNDTQSIKREACSMIDMPFIDLPGVERFGKSVDFRALRRTLETAEIERHNKAMRSIDADMTTGEKHQRAIDAPTSAASYMLTICYWRNAMRKDGAYRG